VGGVRIAWKMKKPPIYGGKEFSIAGSFCRLEYLYNEMKKRGQRR
jgi:hypothetical protein